MKFLIFSAGLLLSAISASASETGFRTLTLDAGGARPLSVAVWYPAVAGPHVTVGENPVFAGIEAVKDGTPEAGAHPLIVLSHGYRGNWRNQNWLAGELSKAGYVVAAPDHPGTTSFDWALGAKSAFWKRPEDVSRVIDALLANAAIAAPIDAKRIAAAGHSLGGWTIMALAGGRFEAARALAGCETTQNSHCRTLVDLGIGADKAVDAAMAGDFVDKRIAAFISLDLGGATGFSPSSLAGIDKPVLIFAADVINPAIGVIAEDSTYIDAGLTAARHELVRLRGTTHFSFMQICKPGASERLEAEAPGDGMVCRDGDGASRDALHGLIAAKVLNFLQTALPPR